MGIHRPSFFVAATITFQLATSQAALAAYDMSGKWLVVENGVRLDITQTGEDLESPIPTLIGGMFGTIDEDTGAFHLESYGRSITHSPIVINGNVAIDSKSFSGTYGYSYVTGPTPHMLQTVIVSYPVTGTRCGNGQIDDGEECDDNNAANGDCCSSTCALDAEGAACNADSDSCTFDVCDGAGTCEHIAHTGACTEPYGCGTGTCATGSCVVTVPAAAGTSCDRDGSLCTPDTCDGAGACANAVPLNCSPCGTCDPDVGCVADDPESDFFRSCYEDPENASLAIRVDDDARRNRLSLSIKEPISVPNRDDLIAFEICVFEEGDTSWPPLWSASIPANAFCGEDRSCWKTTSRGTQFKEGSGDLFGVKALGFDSERGIKLKGKGTNLDLPAELPTSNVSLRYRIEAISEYYTTYCWRSGLDTDESSASEYKGSFTQP